MSIIKANDYKNLSGVSNAPPCGTILPFGGSAIPAGFLQCNGALVSRTTYADLFAIIGTTFGSGDGSTTFELPAAADLPTFSLGIYVIRY